MRPEDVQILEALKDARADVWDWKRGHLTLVLLQQDPPAGLHGEHTKRYLAAYRVFRDAILARWFRKASRVPAPPMERDVQASKPEPVEPEVCDAY